MWVKSITRSGETQFSRTKKSIHKRLALDWDENGELTEEGDESDSEVYLNNRYCAMPTIETYLPFTHDVLPFGVYSGTPNDLDCGTLTVQNYKREDAIIEMPYVKKIHTHLEEFINDKEAYTKYNFPYKRGLLMYGPPGTGKTTVIRQIANTYANSAVILMLPKALPSRILKGLANDTRLKIFIFEELNYVTSSMHGHELQYFLDFLDGVTSLDNTYVIATTNYPEKLPENLAKRHGRFDEVLEIGYLKPKDILIYLNAYEGSYTIEDVDSFTEMTIAQLKEIIFWVKIRNKSLTEAYEIVKLAAKQYEKEFKNRAKIGFIDEDDDL